MKRRLNLQHPPQVVRAGHAVHGARRTEAYRFEDYWTLHWYFYDAALELQGEEIRIRNGSVTLLPPGVRIVYRFPHRDCQHYYAIFSVPRDEGGEEVRLLYEPEEIPSDWGRRFEEAAKSFTRKPERSTALLWFLLWALVVPTDDDRPYPPLLGQAVDIITIGLQQPLRVSAIAGELGVSHNLLTRLFREHLGVTVVGYIRQLRMKRAERLLRHTTLPIKVIARECGLPDAQAFNKVVRSSFGCPPKALRQHSRPGRTP